jgi:hypothetical protein
MWFKKKAKVEKKATKRKIVYKVEPFNVGVTSIRVTFTDEREFVFRQYGMASQYVNDDRQDNGLNARVSDVQVYTSIKSAESLISNSYTGQTSWLDDHKCPRMSLSGTVAKLEILGTKDFEEDFNVASVIEE